MDRRGPETEDERATDPDVRRPRWLTAVLATAVLVAAALLGGAGGLLLAGSGDDAVAAPGAVDVGFAQDMSAHHQQGVAMASIARERSTTPAIHQIAMDIEHTQTEQMGRMRGWLALWSEPMRPAGERMSWMNGRGHGSHERMSRAGSGMPGMATPAELDRLRSLTGQAFDVYFLQLMVRHHQGGTPMLREAIERADVDAVRNLAQQMLTAQSAEVTTMIRMLRERGATPLPEPV